MHFQKVNQENEIYKETIKELKAMSKENLYAKFSAGISNAVSIANDWMIKKALKNNNRELAIESLKNLSKAMKESTDFKNIKVQVHTKDNRSFVRAWMPENLKMI